MHAAQWRAEDSLQESVLSFLCVGPGVQTQIFRLGSRPLHRLNQGAGPVFLFSGVVFSAIHFPLRATSYLCFTNFDAFCLHFTPFMVVVVVNFFWDLLFDNILFKSMLLSFHMLRILFLLHFSHYTYLFSYLRSEDMSCILHVCPPAPKIVYHGAWEDKVHSISHPIWNAGYTRYEPPHLVAFLKSESA